MRVRSKPSASSWLLALVVALVHQAGSFDAGSHRQGKVFRSQNPILSRYNESGDYSERHL